MTKPYASLTEIEKWEWHADVYAFRRIALGVPVEEVISPCDPDGKWYNDGLVRAAAERLQNKRAAAKRRSSVSDEDRRLGRDYLNRWARERGCRDWDAADADDVTVANVVRTMPGPMTPFMPKEKHTANKYGVTATEWQPTPERLARDLAELQARGDIP